MEISVVIPTYRPQEFLWECLNSLRCQTFDHSQFEIVLVLNGCCEPWKSAIESYISMNMSDMNVKFIQTDVSGVSNARNIALDNVDGKYITFIDDDDYVSSQYLEGLYAKVSRDTIAIAYPFAFQDKTNKQIECHITKTYEKYFGLGKHNYLKARKIFSGVWMKLIHKDVIGHSRFDTNFRNGEDMLFMFLISKNFKNVAYTTKNAVYYRRFRDGSSINNGMTYRDNFINNYKQIMLYSKYYLCHPLSSSFIFYLLRVLGAIRSILIFRERQVRFF